MSTWRLPIRLLGKELRQLMPIGLVWLMMVLLQIGYTLHKERLDERSFESVCDTLCYLPDSTFVSLITLLYALVTCWFLFPREHDERTIDYLHALPLGPRQIFVAKVLAAWLLLIALDMVLLSFDLFSVWLDPQTFEGRIYWVELGKLLLRDSLFYFVVISHGVIVSWFRSVGLIAYATLLWAGWVLDKRMGGPTELNLLNFHTTDPWGETLVFANSTILVHLLIAVCALILGYRLWMRPDVSRARRRRRLPVPVRVGGSVFLLGLLGWMLSGVQNLQTLKDTDPAQLYTTQHYRIAANRSAAELMDPILNHADDDLATISDALGADDVPEILVDTTAGESHVAGLAMHGRIRMSLDPHKSDDYNRFVLAHESVHVLQSKLSNGALSRVGASARFFIEGSAQYFAHKVLPNATSRHTERAIAAMAAEREGIRFSDMANDGVFSEKYDMTLHYMLGELWVESLSAACGETMPGTILRTIGSDEAPLGLSGERWWRTLLDSLGCNLSMVNRDFEQRRDVILDDQTRAMFPEWGALSRTRDGNSLFISVPLVLQSDSGEIPEDLWLRVQPGGATVLTPSQDFRGQVIGDDGAGRVSVEFELPAGLTESSGMRYQLGYSVDGEGWPYFSAWRRD